MNMWIPEKDQIQHRKDWINALRSGDYKQGTGLLRDIHDNFCCLGVACDVAGVEWKPIGECYRAIIDGASSDTSLPSSVMRYYGLRDFQGEFCEGPEHTLMSKNDIEKYTFAEIADIIESEPQGLFI